MPANLPFSNHSLPVVAAIQMCSTEQVDENLKSAAEQIAEAASQQAALIVLPEMFAIVTDDPQKKLAAQEIFGNGVIQSFLSEQAKKHACWILGGTIPIAATNQKKSRAASLLYNDQGELAARYDKTHLFDVTLSATEQYQESAAIEAGNELIVTDTPAGKVGFGVCYDVRFPEMFRILFNRGAEIIALPSAFTVKTGTAHWEVLLRARAIENFCYVIAAAQGGTHASGRKTYGHSMIISPWGEMIARQDGTESGVISAGIDLIALHAIRESIPVAQHQKIFFDLKSIK